MNLLTKQPPEVLNIAGREFYIDTDFRLMVEFELLLTEESENFENEMCDFLNRFIPDMDYSLPQQDFVKAIMRYYSCGKESSIETDDEADEQREESQVEQIYSFSYDDEYIYAAFMEAYGIDLTEVKMHWWKFRALFNALPQSCMFSRILGYREMEITSDMSSGQKEFYRKMQRKFALPLPKSEQEKIDAITAALMDGGDLSGVL